MTLISQFVTLAGVRSHSTRRRYEPKLSYQEVKAVGQRHAESRAPGPGSVHGLVTAGTGQGASPET